MRVAIVAGWLVAVALAGCADSEPEDHFADGHTHDEDDHDHGFMPWEMRLEGCEEGGFVALYPKGEGETLAGVWVLADIREEVGNPVRDGLGMPITGPQKGNWHQGFRCDSATVGEHTQETFLFGYVGDMVEAPDWDPGGADVHFLISGLGLLDSPLRDALTDVTTADVTHAEEALTTWYTPRVGQPTNAVSTVYDDREKGTYTSYSIIEPLRDVPERTIRLWWTVPADGAHADLASHGHGGGADDHPEGNWTPVYWDVHTSGGLQLVTPKVHSAEVACHTGTDDHGPAGGACQPTLTTVYNHGSVELVWGGPIENVTLDQVWLH